MRAAAVQRFAIHSFSLLSLILLGMQLGCAHLPFPSARDKVATKLAALKPDAASKAPSMPPPDRTSEGDAQLLVTLARNHELSGNLDQAITDYRKALAIDDQKALPYYRLGVLHDKKGDGKTAPEVLSTGTCSGARQSRYLL